MKLWDAADKSRIAVAQDPFLDDLLDLVHRGVIARLPGSILKEKIIHKIQQYSAELGMAQEEVSKIFLELCDLMLEGRIGRMTPDAFKVYLVLLTWSFVSEEPPSRGVLGELTGIEDPPRLDEALQQLEKDGCIASSQKPRVIRCNDGEPRGIDLPFDGMSYQSHDHLYRFWIPGLESQAR